MNKPAKFRKKPVVIEAIQYLPHTNCSEIAAFLKEDDWDAEECSLQDPDDDSGTNEAPWYIETLEGRMEASPGDWIIKGIKNECYPCKADIFDQSYEAVEE